MKQQAIVRAVSGDEALLAVKRQSICEGCHREGGCSSCTQIVEVTVKNSCHASVGDRVEVETGSGAVIGVAALVFLLPLFVAFGAYALAGLWLTKTTLRYLAAFGALALTYLVIGIVVRRMKAKLSVTMTAIVGRAEDKTVGALADGSNNGSD